jgi:hypothetical protein
VVSTSLIYLCSVAFITLVHEEDAIPHQETLRGRDHIHPWGDREAKLNGHDWATFLMDSGLDAAGTHIQGRLSFG